MLLALSATTISLCLTFFKKHFDDNIKEYKKHTWWKRWSRWSWIIRLSKDTIMSSGQYKQHRGFNPVQIKDGMVVRLRKDGSVKAVLGKYGEYGKQKRSSIN